MIVRVPTLQTIIELAVRRDGVAGYSSDFAWFRTARITYVWEETPGSVVLPPD